MAPPPPMSVELLSKHKHGWKGFESTFLFNDQQTGVASFQITSNKTWRNCRLIQVWLNIRTCIHSYEYKWGANLLGKLLLTFITHTVLQSYMYYSGLLCKRGKLVEVLASKWCLTNCCSQESRQTFRRQETLAGTTYTDFQEACGLKTLLQYSLIASFNPTNTKKHRGTVAGRGIPVV